MYTAAGISPSVSLFARGTNAHSSCISAPGTVFTDVGGFTTLRIYNDYMSTTGVFTPCVCTRGDCAAAGRASVSHAPVIRCGAALLLRYPADSLPHDLDLVHLHKNVRLSLGAGHVVRAESVYTVSTTSITSDEVVIDTRFAYLDGDVYAASHVTLTDASYEGAAPGYTCPSADAMRAWAVSVKSPQDGTRQGNLVDDDLTTRVRAKSESGAWIQASFNESVPVTSVMMKQWGSNYFAST